MAVFDANHKLLPVAKPTLVASSISSSEIAASFKTVAKLLLEAKAQLGNPSSATSDSLIPLDAGGK